MLVKKRGNGIFSSLVSKEVLTRVVLSLGKKLSKTIKDVARLLGISEDLLTMYEHEHNKT